MSSSLAGDSGILFIYNELDNSVNYSDRIVAARCKINTRRLRKSITRYIKKARVIQENSSSSADMRILFEEKIQIGTHQGNPLHVMLKQTGGSAGNKVIAGILLNEPT